LFQRVLNGCRLFRHGGSFRPGEMAIHRRRAFSITARPAECRPWAPELFPLFPKASCAKRNPVAVTNPPPSMPSIGLPTRARARLHGTKNRQPLWRLAAVPLPLGSSRGGLATVAAVD
jgi:hypothetical protein